MTSEAFAKPCARDVARPQIFVIVLIDFCYDIGDEWDGCKTTGAGKIRLRRCFR